MKGDTIIVVVISIMIMIIIFITLLSFCLFDGMEIVKKWPQLQ